MTKDYKPDKEVRVTSETGGQKGQKQARFGGGDPLAYMELARVYGFGEEKYDRYNYLKGYKWSLSVDALLRHLFAFLAGEDRDPESGLLHTSHVAWHGQTLTSFMLRGVGEDDRPPRLLKESHDLVTKTYPAPEAPNAKMQVPLWDSVAEDGCVIYRGRHISPTVKNDPLFYETIDAMMDSPTKCDHGVSLHRPCPDCRLAEED